MLNAQLHRGPDDGGFEVLQVQGYSVALGNRRLAIQDISPLGHQPMINPDTHDVLVYNGELYNAPELRRLLQDEGFKFRSRSDTEVLLRSYERWGIECLKLLKGMFAFAVWDARKRRLLIARDHLGIKPLYYCCLPGKGFAFASEVRALLAGGVVNFEIDRRALAGYLAYGAVQEPLTINEDVRVLEPGSYLEVSVEGRVENRVTYWSIPLPDPTNASVAFNDLVEEGRGLLSQSVRRHMLSDVPLGVFLSSGLDSTSVLGLARQVTAGTVHAFTVCFPDNKDFDEGAVASETARRLGVEYHECAVDSITATEWAMQGMAGIDQPALDGLNTYIVSKAVRQHGFAVALSGQGGDEIFGGYHSFTQIPRWRNWMALLKILPPDWRALLARTASFRMGSVLRSKAGEIAKTGGDLLTLYSHYRRLGPQSDLVRLGLKPFDLNLTQTYQVPELDNKQLIVNDDDIATVSRLETMFYLRNTLLRDGDVFGMANSLEIRVPLLDRDVVEWAYRLPGRVLLPRGRPQKFLLREICADYYTPLQAAQQKRGFTLPFSSWLLGPLRPMMEDCLAAVKDSKLVSSSGIDSIKQTFLSEPHTAAWRTLWCLVSLGYWLTSRKRSVDSSDYVRADTRYHASRRQGRA